MHRVTAWWILSALSLIWVGCGTQRYDDPIAAMLDRERQPCRRLDAAQQAQDQYYDDPARITALEQLAWSRGHPVKLRRYAIDQLVALDVARFQDNLATRIVWIHNWGVLEYIFALGIEWNWPQFTPVIVHSYARPVRHVPDPERLEFAALQRLHPNQTIPQIVLGVLANVDGHANLTQQVAAWQLLNRLVGRDELLSYLRTSTERTRLITDLKAAAAELHVLPHNKARLLWLTFLRNPTNTRFWEAAQAVVATLSPQQRDGLALRHLRPLLLSNPADLRLSRTHLLSETLSELANAEHHTTEHHWRGNRSAYPQRFEDWSNDLSWADLVAIRLFVQLLKDGSIVAELFRQADRDLADKQSEHGGALDRQGTRYRAEMHEPLIESHDRKYVAPPQLIEHLYKAIAHYHFHAQTEHNSAVAAPGRGDRAFADHWGFNCLVFSFIDHDRLNVDYYGPGGVVVDLGTVYR